MAQRYGASVEREVELLEGDLKAWYHDLSAAFTLRDWGEVARIYRRIAAVADRLEEVDPSAYSRALAAAELEGERLLIEPEHDEWDRWDGTARSDDTADGGSPTEGGPTDVR